MYLKAKLCAVLTCAVMVSTTMIPSAAAADTSLWDRVKATGSDLYQSAKAAAPEVIEQGKELAGAAADKAGELYDSAKTKAPEIIDQAKDGLQNAGQQFSEFRADQQDQFWNWFDNQTTGSSNTAASSDPTTSSQDIDPDFVNRSEKIVSEWQGWDPQLEPGPDLSFVDQSDEFAEELKKKHAETYLDPTEEPESDSAEPSSNSQTSDDPESVIAMIPIVGDAAGIIPEENLAPDNTSSTPTTPPDINTAISNTDPSRYEQLNGTLFYDGQWYRETTGEADVVFNGRTFAKTDEAYLNLDASSGQITVLDGYLVELSDDHSVQKIAEERLSPIPHFLNIIGVLVVIIVMAMIFWLFVLLLV